MDQDLKDIFTTQLAQYKKQLSDLSQQRASKVADRDSARFKYVTSWKSRLDSVINAILNSIPVTYISTSGATSAAQTSRDAFKMFSDQVKLRIPMLLLDGSIPKSPDGYATYNKDAPIFVYNDGFDVVSYISPTDSLITKVYQSLGKTAAEYFDLHDSPDHLIQSWFNWVFQGNAGELVYINYPFTTDTFTKFPENYIPQLAVNAQTFGQVVDKNFGNGSLNQVLADGRDMLYDLLSKTTNVLNLNYQMIDLQKQLDAFLKDYQQYGFTADMVPDVAPEGKSKLWLLAAAAAGLVVLNR